MSGMDDSELWGAIIVIGLWIFGVGAWIVNIFKLIGSLGGHDLWGAVVHGIGLIGPAALITVWF